MNRLLTTCLDFWIDAGMDSLQYGVQTRCVLHQPLRHIGAAFVTTSSFFLVQIAWFW